MRSLINHKNKSMRVFIFICFYLFYLNGFAGDKLMMPLDTCKNAVNFTLPDINGKSISLSDFKGKYVLVNFWAIWCSPCVKEIPSMQTMYDSLRKEDLEIIAIHVGSDESGLMSFLSENKVEFAVVIDEEMSVKGWKVPALPMTYLVSPEGELVYKAIGPREWSVNEMRELISFN